jgi:molybdenum cofactor guanylyltransferase
MAGGASSRFGADKALAQLGGEALLAKMVRLLGAVTSGVKIVGNNDYARFGVEIVADRWPGEGPLGGIITALEATAESSEGCAWNLIVSCDMPFLTADWLSYEMNHAAKSEAQAVYPASASGPEPLCACWRTSAAATLRRAFEGGTRKVTDGLKLLRSEVLDERHWKRFDNAGRLFWNMNTAADYEEARRILEPGRV